MIVFDIPFNKTQDSLHKKLLDGVRMRLDLCKRRRGPFDQRIDKNEERCSIYRKKNNKDSDKDLRKKRGESEYAEIIVPYSYALMISAHTYMVNVFLQRDPVWSVTGTNDTGQMKELPLETLLRYQYGSGDHGKNMLVWLFDPCRYGIGLLGSYWCNNEKVVTQIVEEEEMQNGVPTGKVSKRFNRRIIPGYKGNKLFNIHPRDLIFDPRVPFSSLQDMEFIGRRTDITIAEALDKEAQGIYFNVEEAIRLCKEQKATEEQHDVDRVLDELNGGAKIDDKNEILKTPIEGKSGNLHIEEVSVTLIPKQWGISENGNRPEKWHFTIANDEVIICAYPQGTLHQEHPYYALEMELDGYRQNSRALMELMEPMNDVLSWLFNSHMWNRRAAMNNQFIYDPSKVEERDIRSNKAGKHIRLKPTFYGTDVRTVMHQMPVQDVTANAIQDSMQVEKLMQRTSGANEDVAGGSSTSSRRSATEFNATTSFSMGRLARDAFHWSVTGFQSLGRHLIFNSQQFYDAKEKLKVGGYTGVGEEYIEVTPETIAGNFDVVTIDGTLPVSKLQQANFWKEALMGMAQIPEVRMQYRIEDIFAHMSRLGGLMAIEKFRVMPDEEAIRLANLGLLENVTRPSGNSAGGNGQASPGKEGMGTAYQQLAVPQAPNGTS